MVEFNADLYPLSDGTCCYCDEEIPVSQPRGKFEPYGSCGGGVFVMIQLTFCESCLKSIAERANDVYDAIQRHRAYTERDDTSEIPV